MRSHWIEDENQQAKHFVFDEGGDSFYCILCDTTLVVNHKTEFFKHIHTKKHSNRCLEDNKKSSEEPLLKRVELEEEKEVDMSVVDRVLKKRSVDKAKVQVSSPEWIENFLKSSIGQARVEKRALELIEINKKKFY